MKSQLTSLCQSSHHSPDITMWRLKFETLPHSVSHTCRVYSDPQIWLAKSPELWQINSGWILQSGVTTRVWCRYCTRLGVLVLECFGVAPIAFTPLVQLVIWWHLLDQRCTSTPSNYRWPPLVTSLRGISKQCRQLFKKLRGRQTSVSHKESLQKGGHRVTRM